MKFDKQDVFATLLKMEQKWTDELWEKLTTSPITLDLSKYDDLPEVKEVMIFLAIASLEA